MNKFSFLGVFVMAGCCFFGKEDGSVATAVAESRSNVSSAPEGVPPFLIVRMTAAETESAAKWGEVLAALKANPGCCDEVWFSTGMKFPTLEIHRRNAEIQAKAAADCREAGIGPGLQIQATIGHYDRLNIDSSGRDWSGGL